MNTAIDFAITETLLYPQQTKHDFHRYARSAVLLDWAIQPNPFRCYEGMLPVRLPLRQSDPAGEHLALYERSRNAFQDFTRETNGVFLELSLGLSAWKSIPGSTWSLRMNPSSGNLHPTEAYLIQAPFSFRKANARWLLLNERTSPKRAGSIEPEAISQRF